MSRDRRWRFGRFEFDPGAGALREADVPVAISAKPAALLLHLLRHAGQIVSKRELIDVVWPDTTVSEAAFQSVLRDLRRCLGESGASDRWVETIRGRGLRFRADVEALESESEPAAKTSVDEPWSETTRRLESALRALEDLEQSRGGSAIPSRERSALLVAMARARWAMGAPAEARSLFREAADAARRLEDPEVFARAALGLAGRTDAASVPSPEAVAALEEAIAWLGEAQPHLTVELRARLGTELAGDSRSEQAEALTEDALARAEDLGDEGLLAYVLTARHFALQHPDADARERLGLTDRAIALVGEGRPTDVLAIALQERLFDTLELADGDGFDTTLRRYATVVDELALPFFRWMHRAFSGCRALLAGELEDAERLAHEALDLGGRVGTDNAASMFASQLYAVRDAQGRTGELYPMLREALARPGASAGFRAATAAAAHSAGSPDAEEILTSLVSELDAWPRDRNFLPALAVLTEPIVARRDRRGARRLCEAFAEAGDRVVVAAHGAMVLGSARHHRGRLLAVLGDPGGARAQLDAALEAHRRLASPTWVARTRRAIEELPPPHRSLGDP